MADEIRIEIEWLNSQTSQACKEEIEEKIKSKIPDILKTYHVRSGNLHVSLQDCTTPDCIAHGRAYIKDNGVLREIFKRIVVDSGLLVQFHDSTWFNPHDMGESC